jgi:hypothetical protein
VSGRGGMLAGFMRRQVGQTVWVLLMYQSLLQLVASLILFRRYNPRSVVAARLRDRLWWTEMLGVAVLAMHAPFMPCHGATVANFRGSCSRRDSCHIVPRYLQTPGVACRAMPVGSPIGLTMLGHGACSHKSTGVVANAVAVGR